MEVALDVYQQALSQRRPLIGGGIVPAGPIALDALFQDAGGLNHKPAFGLCGITKRAPGLEFGILRGCELAKSLSRHLPMRLVLKSQIHVQHKRVRTVRILDPIGAGFRPEFDGFEGHRRNFVPFVGSGAI